MVDHSAHDLNALFSKFATQAAIDQNVDGRIDDCKDRKIPYWPFHFLRGEKWLQIESLEYLFGT